MLTTNAYTTRLASYTTSDHYSSFPAEQRQKAFVHLTQKSLELGKKAPVYLQIELAKTTASILPFSPVA